MVLSNKKLKQKLRSLLAESISATESKKSRKNSAKKEDISEQLKCIKEQLLGSKSRKPESPKPKKRRKKPPPLPENPKADEGSEETQKGNEEKKSKKRKREADGDQGLSETKKEKPKKKKNKKKQKKKKEKVKKEEENDERKGEEQDKGTESVGDTESNEKRVEGPIKIDESETKKVYVGGIPYYSTEDDIMSFFEGCGTVTEVDCMTFPESGKFRGIAFLTFKTEAAAKRALALDGADMGGFYLKIQPYKAHRTAQQSDFAPEIVDGYNRAYVGNLSWDITEDDLKQFFSDCKVSTIRFGMDKETGDFKGYAHVDFSDSVSLTVALELDQKVLCGRLARIRCAVPKKGGETNSGKNSSSKKAENDGMGGSSKKKRRTCYECGIPGHLSSACPRKKAVQVDGSDVKS